MESRVDFVIDDYMKLIHKIANNFKKNFIFMEYDDVFQICAIGIMEALKCFDESRNVKFTTFAYRVCMNKVYRYRKQTTWFSGTNDNRRYDIPTYLDAHIKDYKDGYMELVDLVQSNDSDFEDRELIILLQEILDDREFEIIYRFYFQGWNNTEIAKMISLSQPHTCRLRIAALEKLKDSLVNRQKKSSLSYQN